jgi:hypothetical protein
MRPSRTATIAGCMTCSWKIGTPSVRSAADGVLMHQWQTARF